MNLLDLGKNKIKRAFRESELNVAVFGLGKMGLPLAAVFADKGARVIGVDIDEKRVEEINSGINPIKEEPGLEELAKNANKNNRGWKRDSGQNRGSESRALLSQSWSCIPVIRF